MADGDENKYFSNERHLDSGDWGAEGGDWGAEGGDWGAEGGDWGGDWGGDDWDTQRNIWGQPSGASDGQYMEVDSRHPPTAVHDHHGTAAAHMVPSSERTSIIQRQSVSLPGGGGAYNASPRPGTGPIRIKEHGGDVTSVKSPTVDRSSGSHPEDGKSRESENTLHTKTEQVEEPGPATKEVGVQMYPALTATFLLPNCGRSMTPGEMLVGYKRGSRSSDMSVPPLRFSELQKRSRSETTWSDALSGKKRAGHGKQAGIPDTDDEEEEVDELEEGEDAQSTSGDCTSTSGVASSSSDRDMARRGSQRSRTTKHRPPTQVRFKVPAYAIQAYSQLAGARRDIEEFLADHTRTKLYAPPVDQCVQAGRPSSHFASQDWSARDVTWDRTMVSSPHAFVSNKHGFSNSPRFEHRESLPSSRSGTTGVRSNNKYIIVRPEPLYQAGIREATPTKVEHITKSHISDELGHSSRPLRAHHHTPGSGAPKISCQGAIDDGEDEIFCSGRRKHVHWYDMNLVIPYKRTYATVPIKDPSMATCERCEEEEWVNARMGAWRSEQFVDGYGYERHALRRKVRHAAEAEERRKMAEGEERRGRRTTFVRDAELRPRKEDDNQADLEDNSEVNIEDSSEVNIEVSSEVNIEDSSEVNIEVSSEVSSEVNIEVSREDSSEVNIETNDEQNADLQDSD